MGTLTHTKVLFYLLLATVLFPIVIYGQTPDFKSVIDLKWPLSPTISPDGSMVAFREKSTNWEKNRYSWVLRVRDISTNTDLYASDPENPARSPQWLSSGRSLLLYSLNSQEGPRIMRVELPSGSVSQHAQLPKGASQWRADSSGQHIAYLLNRDDPVRTAKYSADDDIPPGQRIVLFAVGDGKTRDLLSLPHMTVQSLSWSPDGERIAFSGTDFAPDPFKTDSDLYYIEIETAALHRLTNNTIRETRPLWSPESDSIAYQFSAEDKPDSSNSSIAMMNIKQPGKSRVITGSIDNSAFLDAWTGSGLWFRAHVQGTMQVFRLTSDDREPQQVTNIPGAFIMQFSASNTGATAFCLTTPEHAFELGYLEPGADTYGKLTDFTAPMRLVKKSTVSTVRWTAPDGMEISGVLMVPPGEPPAKKAPLLVFVHGGPVDVIYPRYVQEWNELFPFEQWVQRGAYVFFPNYRGSTGFGQAFRQANFGNFGEAEKSDILSGIDALAEQYPIDTGRVGVMGWSYGGYLSAYLSLATDRFAAACVGAGIADWSAMYGIWPYWLQDYNHDKTPWTDPGYYRRISPVAYINRGKTPTLIVHGDNDAVVPQYNAELLYYSLRNSGVPVRKLIFEGYGHGIWSPREKKAMCEELWRWFESRLWLEE